MPGCGMHSGLKLAFSGCSECLCTVLSDVKDGFEESETIQIIAGLYVGTCLYYLTEVSKTRQYRIPPFLLANRTFPAGFLS